MKKIKFTALIAAVSIFLSGCASDTPRQTTRDPMAEEYEREISELKKEIDEDTQHRLNFLAGIDDSDTASEDNDDDDDNNDNDDGNDNNSSSDPDWVDVGAAEDEEGEDDIVYPITYDAPGDNYAVYCSNFIGESALVISQKNNEHTYHLINNKGETIYSTDSFYIKPISNDRYTVNDYYVIDGKGYIMVDPDKNGATGILGYTDKYIFIYKEETGFSGNQFYFGVTDLDGKWIVPLTKDLSFFDEGSIDFTYRDNWANSYNDSLNGGFFAIVSDSIVRFVGSGSDIEYGSRKGACLFYDFLKDKTINAADILERYYDYKNLVFYEDKYAFFETYKEVYRYDLETDELKLIFNYNDYVSKSLGGLDLERVLDNALIIDCDYADGYYLVDFDGNLLMDLKNYDVKSLKTASYADGKLVVICRGQDGRDYLCVIGSDGNLVFDPVNVGNSIKTSSFSDSVELPIVSDGKIVCSTAKDNITILDLDGNVLNIVTVSGDFKNINLDEEVILCNTDTLKEYTYYGYDGPKMIVTA